MAAVGYHAQYETMTERLHLMRWQILTELFAWKITRAFNTLRAMYFHSLPLRNCWAVVYTSCPGIHLQNLLTSQSQTKALWLWPSILSIVPDTSTLEVRALCSWDSWYVHTSNSEVIFFFFWYDTEIVLCQQVACFRLLHKLAVTASVWNMWFLVFSE